MRTIVFQALSRELLSRVILISVYMYIICLYVNLAFTIAGCIFLGENVTIIWEDSALHFFF